MTRVALIAPSLLLLAMPATAQESDAATVNADQQTEQQQAKQQQSLGQPVRVADGPFLSSAEDADVLDVGGQTVGEIEEILIDRDGNPAAFLVELDGFLGIADGDVTMPLDSLRYNGTAYVTDMTQDEIERLQTFND